MLILDQRPGAQMETATSQLAATLMHGQETDHACPAACRRCLKGFVLPLHCLCTQARLFGDISPLLGASSTEERLACQHIFQSRSASGALPGTEGAH